MIDLLKTYGPKPLVDRPLIKVEMSEESIASMLADPVLNRKPSMPSDEEWERATIERVFARNVELKRERDAEEHKKARLLQALYPEGAPEWLTSIEDKGERLEAIVRDIRARTESEATAIRQREGARAAARDGHEECKRLREMLKTEEAALATMTRERDEAQAQRGTALAELALLDAGDLHRAIGKLKKDRDAANVDRSKAWTEAERTRGLVSEAKTEIARLQAEVSRLTAELALLRVDSTSSYGVVAIAHERAKQVAQWDAKGDDGYRYGEICIAAAKLLVKGTDASVNDPHDIEWNVHRKPYDALRQLTVAGALCAAEIDRIKRYESAELAAVRATPGPASDPHAWGRVGVWTVSVDGVPLPVRLETMDGITGAWWRGLGPNGVRGNAALGLRRPATPEETERFEAELARHTGPAPMTGADRFDPPSPAPFTNAHLGTIPGHPGGVGLVKTLDGPIALEVGQRWVWADDFDPSCDDKIHKHEGEVWWSIDSVGDCWAWTEEHFRREHPRLRLPQELETQAPDKHREPA